MSKKTPTEELISFICITLYYRAVTHDFTEKTQPARNETVEEGEKKKKNKGNESHNCRSE